MSDEQHNVNVILNSQFAQYDAREREWTFRMDDFNPRAIRASLGTCELPPSQCTVEHDWRHVSFDEGLALPDDEDRALLLKGSDEPLLRLPLQRNRLKECRRSGSFGLRITTELPHGVVTPGNVNVAKQYDTGIGVVLTPSGLSVGHAVRVVYRNDTSFDIFWEPSDGVRAKIVGQRATRGASLQAAALSSVAQAAAAVMAAMPADGALRVWASEDGSAALWQGADVDGDRGLGAALGMRQGVAEGTASRGVSNPYGTRGMLPEGNYDLRRMASAWPRVFTPLMPSGTSESGTLRMFLSDGSRMVGVPLTSRSYTLRELEGAINAATVDAENRANTIGGAVARVPPIAISITDGYVTVAAEDGESTFGLTFEVAESVDASMLGFEPASYEGRASYTAPHRISYPLLHRAGGPDAAPRPPRLQYSLGTVQQQPRLAIVTKQKQLPVVDGVVQGGELCDMRQGDLLYLSGVGFVHLQDSEIVMASQRRGTGGAPPPPVASLRITIEETDQITGVVTVAPDAAPALHLGVRDGDTDIKPYILGFEQRSYHVPRAAGGGPITGPVSIPRISAPGNFVFDHVPYVLLEIGNGISHPTTLQRAVVHGGRTLTPFAKVAFVPYRVERVNPAEVHYKEGECIGPVRLRIYNPDGSHYHTHGTPFGLSLTVTTVEP